MGVLAMGGCGASLAPRLVSDAELVLYTYQVGGLDQLPDGAGSSLWQISSIHQPAIDGSSLRVGVGLSRHLD